MFVDSSFLAGLGRGADEAVSFYEENADVGFTSSTIVAYELFAGLVDQQSDQGSNHTLDKLRADLDWVEFVDYSLEDARETGRLETELESKGRRIPVPDMMIAAAARRRGETLVAADDHFSRVKDLDYANFRE